MGVAVFDGLYQVWPSSVGQFFVGEEQEIDFDDLYMMDSAPFEFQVYTYNEDETHKHFLAVRIGLVSQDVFMARFLPQRSQAYLVEMLSKMADERDELARIQREQIESTVFEWMVSEQMKEQRKKKRADKRERAKEPGEKTFVEIKPPVRPRVIEKTKWVPAEHSRAEPDESLGFMRSGDS